MNTLAFLNFENPFVLIMIAGIALIIFGRRLPEVGKNLGKGIVEFKKGLAGIDDDVNKAANAPPAQQQPPVQQIPAQQPPRQLAPPANAVSYGSQAAQHQQAVPPQAAAPVDSNATHQA